jgi:hypothetical protein
MVSPGATTEGERLDAFQDPSYRPADEIRASAFRQTFVRAANPLLHV